MIKVWCLALAIACIQISTAAAERVPVIHSTDILYPPDDPDDYFDLACVYAIPRLDCKLVVLDQGEKQAVRPGKVAVQQLNQLAGRNVPAAVGLCEKLTSTTDRAENQPEEFQDAVLAILGVLRESETSVVISIVGSARDVCAAFNREPELFRTKAKAIYVFCGEASHPDFIEWNVSMDPLAFAGIMRSGLPICWIPCFDGGLWQNRGRASYWKTTQGEMLKGVPDPLLQFFISATQEVTSHPLAFMRQQVDPDHKARLFAQPRNMWGGALLGAMADAPVDTNCKLLTPDAGLYSFQSISADFNVAGRATYGIGNRMLRITTSKPDVYAAAMTSATATLLQSFPMTTPH